MASVILELSSFREPLFRARNQLNNDFPWYLILLSSSLYNMLSLLSISVTNSPFGQLGLWL